MDAKFDELPGKVDTKIQEVVNDDDYKRGLRRFVDKSARKKYEKKQAASFLERVKPIYYSTLRDTTVRWLSDDVYNSDDIEEDGDHLTVKPTVMKPLIYLVCIWFSWRTKSVS